MAARNCAAKCMRVLNSEKLLFAFPRRPHTEVEQPECSALQCGIFLARCSYGLTTIQSSYGPEETMNRFEAEVIARGMIAFRFEDNLTLLQEMGVAKVGS